MSQMCRLLCGKGLEDTQVRGCYYPITGSVNRSQNVMPFGEGLCDDGICVQPRRISSVKMLNLKKICGQSNSREFDLSFAQDHPSG